jgi:hypothetical protein
MKKKDRKNFEKTKFQKENDKIMCFRSLINFADISKFWGKIDVFFSSLMMILNRSYFLLSKL